MSLADLVAHATDKERFPTLEQYIAFCSRYLEFGKHKAPAMAGETGPKALEPQFIVSQARSPCDGW